jgi:hypothetical protein
VRIAGALVAGVAAFIGTYVVAIFAADRGGAASGSPSDAGLAFIIELVAASAVGALVFALVALTGQRRSRRRGSATRDESGRWRWPEE